MHTTVIRAADLREVGNMVRNRAPKTTDVKNDAKMFCSPTLLSENRFQCNVFFTKSLKRRAPAAVARLVCVEMIASETPERCRSTFLESVCFSANKRLDFIYFVFRCC